MCEDLKSTLIKLTSDLVSIPGSCKRNNELKNSISFIKGYLSDLDSVHLIEHSHNDIPSLVAMPAGIHEPEILLISHVDVVDHTDVDSYKAQIVDGRIYGPGTGDMKGALSIMLELFRHFHTNHPGISLGLAITSDEEVGGQSGIGYLFDNVGLRSGIVINPDGGSLNEVTVAEKGVIHLKIKVKGNSSHAARPWLGENALELLLTKLSEIKDEIEDGSNTDDNWHTTCSVTIINTNNSSINRIPDYAEAVLDIRFPTPFSVEEKLSRIKDVINNEADYEVILSAEPVEFESDIIFQKSIKSVTKLPVSLIREDGASDCRYIHKCGIPVIIARPLVGDLHTVNEWIEIDSMIKFYQVCKVYITEKLLAN